MHRIDHDGSFRSVFSDPRAVRDLICGYVDSELGRLLDWSTLKLVATRYASEGFKQSESDMICEVQVRGGGGQVVYLLLEFQSSRDWTMALRVWNYLGQFCASLAKLDGVKQRRQLPPVLPIVVYNGEREWTAAREMGELVESGPGGWSEPGPRLGYAFVDVFRSAELDRSKPNIADALFRLQRVGSMEAARDEVRWLKEWMGGEQWATLRRTLVVNQRTPAVAAAGSENSGGGGLVGLGGTGGSDDQLERAVEGRRTCRRTCQGKGRNAGQHRAATVRRGSGQHDGCPARIGQVGGGT